MGARKKGSSTTQKTGTVVEVVEQMTVAHTAKLTEVFLLHELVVDYLRADDSEVHVRISVAGRNKPEPKIWKLDPIVRGDFKSELMKGFCEFAWGVLIERTDVVLLRQKIIIHAGGMAKAPARPSTAGVVPIHSEDNAIEHRKHANRVFSTGFGEDTEAAGAIARH